MIIFVVRSLAFHQSTSSLNDFTIVTHCDVNYLPRALTLFKSLKTEQYSGTFVIFVHDQESYEKLALLNLESMIVYKIDVLEGEFPELLQAKLNRSNIEFYFCITPFLIKYLQNEFSSKYSIYIDADIFFFAPVIDLVDDLSECDVAITPHRFSSRNKFLEKYGLFNVGLVCFSNEPAAKKILDWWAVKCLESTARELSLHVYGDQKYLDRFIELGGNVRFLSGAGQNAAPWNLVDASLSGNRIVAKSDLDESPLIFFHFSGLKQFPLLTFLGFMPFRTRPTRMIKALIYKPYLISLRESQRQLDLHNLQKLKFPKCIEFINYLRYKDFIFAGLQDRNSRPL